MIFKYRSRRIRLSAVACCVFVLTAGARHIQSVKISTSHGMGIIGYELAGGETLNLPAPFPVFTCMVNGRVISTLSFRAVREKDSIRWTSAAGLSGSVREDAGFRRGWKAIVTFRNVSRDTTELANVVPLGEGSDRVYIRSAGPLTYQHRLSRSALFRPGVGPIGVVLPDNAWEMGFCDVRAVHGRSLTGIARRLDSSLADVRRFRALIPPGGWVQYVLYMDDHAGDWHSGLRMMFQERWLYDLELFDNTLFERRDLSWIRRSYLLVLQFAWDSEYYDAKTGESRYEQFLVDRGTALGGFDAYMIWPTWPRLGLDQRNQWDMYRDLPGGLSGLRRQAAFAHSRGVRYFIAYNPWDQSTRREDHLVGMEEMLRTLDADGVVLDTWGQSSREFQAAADRVKPGVVLYSEGMAIPNAMPGIVAGRVHDAIFMPPPLNLNKFIKPDFGIFRVVQLAEGRIHREIAVSFFNGYGTELNIMKPGRPDWIDEELVYLGRTTKILRENSAAFLSPDWVPLLSTTIDSIWVNKWPTPSKTLYTVYSLKPEGFSGPLFEVPASPDSHYVSLWNHEEVDPVAVHGASHISSTIDGFSRSWLGTRREGNVDCLALFPRLLDVDLDQDSLSIRVSAGDTIAVWAGAPSYTSRCVKLPAGSVSLSLRAALGRHEEKFVVQLFDATELMDERVVHVPLATPRLISRREMTAPAATAPPDMVRIPAGMFMYSPTRTFLSPNEVIPYPGSTNTVVTLPAFYIDRFPVTNAAFKEFLTATGYQPPDTTNFLKHWVQGSPPRGLEDHPVVYVDRSDAHAYARWAGKRLPTEKEWQYAAQGGDGRKYPWGNIYDSTKCNHHRGATTPVGTFPEGVSPFGVLDLVGNVWQLTDDLYDNGTSYFTMIRGGSYYNPASSWWYIQGGPQRVDHPQILLHVSPGFDRSSTVGFRCVKDAVQ